MKDMLAWLELRAAVLMKLERREDAAVIFRSAAYQVAHRTSRWLQQGKAVLSGVDIMPVTLSLRIVCSAF